MLVSIGEAAEIIGVSISTLRRWEEEGCFLPSTRTLGGHRRYKISDINKEFFKDKIIEEKERVNICYARVSSHDQKLDLERQSKALEKYCEKNKIQHTLIKDLGSGINFKKHGLKKLIKMICRKEVSKLIITHKDRLLRFGTPLLYQLCDEFQTEIIITEEVENRSFEQDLVTDVLEIITVFSAKLYGKRSHQFTDRLKSAS